MSSTPNYVGLVLTVCGITGPGKINKLVATPCTEEPCDFKRGTTVTYTIDMIPSHDSNSANVDVTNSVLGIQVPVPDVKRNLCEDGPCPLQAGVPVTFNIEFPVASVQLASKTTLTIKITGDNGVEVCAKSPIVFS